MRDVKKVMKERYYYKKGSNQTCFICDELATTGDHLPPQGFFSKSLRKQDYSPLKVPACKKHNDISKLDDEYARLILATGSPGNSSAQQLFKEHILPKAKEQGGSKLMVEIYNRMEPTLIKQPSGILAIGYRFKIDYARLQNVIQKIAYGLYWHHNGRRVPDGCGVSCFCYNRNIPEDELRCLSALPLLSVGNQKVFEYRYYEFVNDPNTVYIAMMFFESQLIEVAIGKT